MGTNCSPLLTELSYSHEAEFIQKQGGWTANLNFSSNLNTWTDCDIRLILVCFFFLWNEIKYTYTSKWHHFSRNCKENLQIGIPMINTLYIMVFCHKIQRFYVKRYQYQKIENVYFHDVINRRWRISKMFIKLFLRKSTHGLDVRHSFVAFCIHKIPTALHTRLSQISSNVKWKSFKFTVLINPWF
jgi:hypothetical protein